MLETWLSKGRLLSNSTPKFLTDDEELTEQPSSVSQCCRLLLVGALVLIINTSFFSEFSNGPSTEPWGTPYCTCDRYDTSSFTATNWWWSDKYDLNHANALPLMPTKFSCIFKRILWSIVSNAPLRSRSTNREMQPRSDDKSRSFVTLMRAVSVLWDGLNPDWKSS